MHYPITKILEELLNKAGNCCQLIRYHDRLVVNVGSRSFEVAALAFEDTGMSLLSTREIEQDDDIYDAKKP